MSESIVPISDCRACWNSNGEEPKTQIINLNLTPPPQRAAFLFQLYIRGKEDGQHGELHRAQGRARDQEHLRAGAWAAPGKTAAFIFHYLASREECVWWGNLDTKFQHFPLGGEPVQPHKRERLACGISHLQTWVSFLIRQREEISWKGIVGRDAPRLLWQCSSTFLNNVSCSWKYPFKLRKAFTVVGGIHYALGFQVEKQVERNWISSARLFRAPVVGGGLECSIPRLKHTHLPVRSMSSNMSSNKISNSLFLFLYPSFPISLLCKCKKLPITPFIVSSESKSNILTGFTSE